MLIVEENRNARIVSPLLKAEWKAPKSPKDFIIKPICVEKAVSLNRIWHSRLPKISNPFAVICFAAIYGNVYFATAIWANPVARLLNGKGYLELRRMAISKESPRNTASRMLSIMEKKIKQDFPEIKKLISYQDTEVHHGTIYKAANWKIGNVSNSGCWLTRRRNKTQTDAVKIRWEKDLYE